MISDSKADKVVQISLNENGMPVPDQDPVQVSAGKECVKWIAGFDFRINITGYEDVRHQRYDNDRKWDCRTGYFANHGQYKYTISANGIDNDPIIDVQPSDGGG